MLIGSVGICPFLSHCVTVRLRTHLGGPTQTFAALERMLLDVPHLCRIDFGRREMVMGGLASPTTVQLLPLRLLIEFVEALKKDIYNSYEGSAVLSPPPTLSSLFFRANKKVCPLDTLILMFARTVGSYIASIECLLAIVFTQTQLLSFSIYYLFIYIF